MDNQHTNQHSPAEAGVSRQEPPLGNINNTTPLVTAVVITALLVGGVVFITQQQRINIANERVEALQQQVAQLQNETEEQQVQGGQKEQQQPATTTNPASSGNATGSTQDTTTTGEIDTPDWETYRNGEFGFEVKYPPELTKIDLGPSNYYLDKKAFKNEESNAYIELGVSTTESIENYNKDCENVGGPCYSFSPFNCEVAGDTDCSEYWHAIMAGAYYKRAVFNKGDVRVQLRVSITTPPEEIPRDSDLDSDEDLKKFGNKNDIKNVEIFNQILSTFRFIETGQPDKSASSETSRQFSEKEQRNIRKRADSVVKLLAERNIEQLASYVHPEKGVRFSPQTFVWEGNPVFQRQELVEAYRSDEEHVWGETGGAAFPITLPFREYIEKWVYERDYAQAPETSFNETLGRGTTINNIRRFYPAGAFVEYYFPKEETVAMDWSSLRLVFEEYQNQWYLVGIVHAEWTP